MVHHLSEAPIKKNVQRYPRFLQNMATIFVVMAYSFSIHDQHLLVLIHFPVWNMERKHYSAVQ